MVPRTRAPLGADSLRPLNAPRPIRVQTDAQGHPISVRRRGWAAARSVEAIQDRWRIDDEWWREHPVSRLYHSLLLDDGTLLTLYHDLLQDTWFEQRE